MGRILRLVNSLTRGRPGANSIVYRHPAPRTVCSICRRFFTAIEDHRISHGSKQSHSFYRTAPPCRTTSARCVPRSDYVVPSEPYEAGLHLDVGESLSCSTDSLQDFLHGPIARIVSNRQRGLPPPCLLIGSIDLFEDAQLLSLHLLSATWMVAIGCTTRYRVYHST